MTKTPRTDAAESNWWSEDGLRSAFIVRADFARELEREIARLTAERDEMQGELRKAETESSMLRVECGVIAAERDEARRDAERWEDDALRLLNERNAAQEERDDLRSIVNKALRERDEARREVCRWAAARYRSEFQHYSTVNAIDYAEKRGWRDAWREGKE